MISLFRTFSTPGSCPSTAAHLSDQRARTVKSSAKTGSGTRLESKTQLPTWSQLHVLQAQEPWDENNIPGVRAPPALCFFLPLSSRFELKVEFSPAKRALGALLGKVQWAGAAPDKLRSQKHQLSSLRKRGSQWNTGALHEDLPTVPQSQLSQGLQH